MNARTCGVFFLLALLLAAFAPAPARAAFGLTTDSTYYTVDTGAGLVFKIRRVDLGSSTQSPGDIASLIYNGVQYQDQSRGSQVNSGFDYIYLNSSAVAVSADTIGTDYIRITVTCTAPLNAGQTTPDYLTHYYLARRGYPYIYMGTYFTREPEEEALCRYILRIQRSVLTNGPGPSDLLGTDTTVESSDIFGFGPTNVNTALIGQTRSKHYSNMRVIDWSYIGATGTNVGLWVVRDNYEGASGGPFYRSLLNQGTSTDQEVTYIVNYGEAQTESPYRLNILNTYTLVFTNGAAPTLPIDTSFFPQMGMVGYVPDSARGSVAGVSIAGRDTSYAYTVGFANTTAQYFAAANASDGSFTCPRMLPGTYTMTVYKNELAVYISSVTVNAGNVTNLSGITITGDPSFVTPVWRIGNWDGTPREFLNGDKITTMHPSDVRMAAWSPGPYVVGSSTPATGFPCYQWKSVNANQVVQFTLTAAQIKAYTIRVGLTTAYAGGRPNISVNSWTAGLQGSSTQPSSRTLTIGSYRGNNITYAFSVPSSAFIVGTNTLTIYPISGSSGTTYLSPGYSTDSVDMVMPINTIGGVVTLQACASNAQPLTFTFTPTGSTGGSVIVQNVTPGSDGTFLLSTIPAGTYTMGIKGLKWLRKNVSIDTTHGSVTIAPVTLLGGDVDNDNQIGANDLALVRKAFGTIFNMTNWNDNADINCDGQVAGTDVAIVRANYGQVGN